MKIIYFDPRDESRVDFAAETAVEFLRDGKVIIYPTDTVYGIGCDATDASSIERIIRMKKRDSSRPLSVIIQSIESAREISFLDARAKKIMEKFLPGPYTFILPGVKRLSEISRAGGNTVGIRIPDNPLTKKISEKFENPIITTSVNIFGSEPLSDPFQIAEFFSKEEEKPDLFIDGGKIEKSDPSIVIDLTRRNPQILRSGNRTAKEVLELLGKLKNY